MTDLNMGALVLLRERLRKRAPLLALVPVPGLADDVKLIGESLDALEQAVRGLAVIVCRKHYGHHHLDREQWEVLTRLAGKDVPWDGGHAHP